MVEVADERPSLWWCSRCYRVSDAASSGFAPFFEGYHSCPWCPGVCLVLPARFREYARSALVVLAWDGHTDPAPLVELGRVIGYARTQHVRRSVASRVAAVVDAEPGLRDLLVSAQECGELDDALLTLWIVVGELRIAAQDPSVIEIAGAGDGRDRLGSLFRVIFGAG